MKEKIPTQCKIKDKLVYAGLLYRSPSAFYSCKYGFIGNSIRCMNCPKHTSTIGKYISEYLNQKDIPPTSKEQKQK